MSPILTLVTILAIYIPALILPGPNFVAVVNSSVRHGARAGLLTTLGTAIGLAMFAALSLIGFAALLAHHPWLTWVVRIAGGAYLIYLGIQLVQAQPQAEHGEVGETSFHRDPFLFGLLVALSNPKGIVLFATVFNAAVTDTTPA